MRTSILLIFALTLPPAAFAEPAKSAPPPTVKKVALVALAKDTARAAEIEGALKMSFGERGIEVEPIRIVFDRNIPVKTMAEQLQARGIDHLLCVAPRKTIRITKSDKTSRISTLESCLKAYATNTMPGGEPLEATPYSVEPNSKSTPSTLRTPIPNDPSAGPFLIVKGTLRLFDINTRKMAWEKDVHTKVPSDLNTDLQSKYIAREIFGAIEKAGIVPPKS